MTNTLNQPPSSGWRGITRYWRNDLLAAFSVALVAIPLGLGKSIASGAPPIAGVITAIVGGLFMTFYRGSHVSINGPGAGLIVVTLAGITTLSDPGMSNGWSYYMAAIIMAGGLQTIIGWLKWGRYADYLPSSVVKGMLAGIGIIIFASQVHIALDTGYHGHGAWESLKVLPSMMDSINWPIAIIAINSLTILIIHPLFINRFKFLHYIPAPMLVVLAAIPFVFLFDLKEAHDLVLFGKSFPVSPEKNLISIPANFLDSFTLRPNWGKIGTLPFWMSVVAIVIVSSVECLMSSKAIEKLDPYRREINLNKDLSGSGISTMIAGFLGGLPVITVIVRSSLNINHGAKTRWSNFYHGLLVLLMVVFAGDLIHLVPQAALAAILVFTGYKLCSPKLFSNTYKMGYEQLVIVVFTIVSAIQSGLISGLMLGTIMTLLIHLVKSHIPVNLFYRFLRNPQYRVVEEEGQLILKVKGVSNFTNLLAFSNKLNDMRLGGNVIIDFSQARLVDHSILELAYNWGDKNQENGGQFDIIGLDEHITTSQHPLSLQVLPLRNVIFLSNRQQRLKEIVAEHQWEFDASIKWSKSRFRKFKLFENRSLEFSRNYIFGSYESNGLNWEVCDITFDEGAFIAAEVHNSTALLVQLPFEIPKFAIEKETFFHRILDLATKEDIDFDQHPDFSSDFSVVGSDNEAVRQFFGNALINFLMSHPKYHIESNRQALLILKSYRFNSPAETLELIQFSEGLVNTLISEYQERKQVS
ncbi:MAG: SulP family inorganic anion transporter [Bacteroidetes bacterium]|nr:SulP family inorganic anion transporter [Bacteroidota bacterium]